MMEKTTSLYSNSVNLPTKACDEKQVLNSVSYRVRQGKVDKCLDV